MGVYSGQSQDGSWWHIVLPTSSIMIVLSPLVSLMKGEVATYKGMVYGGQQDDIAVWASIAYLLPNAS